MLSRTFLDGEKSMFAFKAVKIGLLFLGANAAGDDKLKPTFTGYSDMLRFLTTTPIYSACAC